MSDHFSVEELIIDDSFANYCFQSNEADILFWEEYINTHPWQKEAIEEAMQIVLGLRAMLRQDHDEQREEQGVLKAVPPSANKPFIRKMIRYAAAVAAAVVLIVGIKSYLGRNDSTGNRTKDIAAATATKNSALEFATGKGEKKVFFLSDSTKVWLAAGSTLRIENGFGKNNRGVHLNGEALFDVTHNKDLPFIVHSNQYDVKVLGTLFNVKAYSNDQLSETSLIRGKVEISMKNTLQKIMLKPNQKAVISNKGDNLVLEDNKQVTDQGNDGIAVLPLSYSATDSVVIETAWAQNRLEIVNESFAEIKNKLERWYNVKVVFADEEVGHYTFTATFVNETIGQVLKALQYSYHFTYKTEGETITIYK